MLNRRSFVQRLGASVVGLSTLEYPRTAAARQVAAVAGIQDGAAFPTIRIGNNENPYGPAPAAIDAVGKALMGANRYPGQLVQMLADTIAQKHNVPVDHVLVSGGSGDILRAVVYTYTDKQRALVTGLPTYEAPTRSAQHVGAPRREVPLTAALTLDIPAMTAKAVGAGLVYICNPNNPSATVVPAADVKALVERVAVTSPRTHVLVDEAYFEYADDPAFDTAIPLVAKYPTVIVARSFSKIHAMAGMRVGYAIAQPKTLDVFREHHSGSGLSVMSLSAATTSLLDADNVEKNRALNRAVRRMAVESFENAGYTVAASDANFMFVNVRRDARLFQEACRQRGVQIGRAFPPLTNWARISIGTQDEMEHALAVFMDVLAAPPASHTASLEHLDLLPSELT